MKLILASTLTAFCLVTNPSYAANWDVKHLQIPGIVGEHRTFITKGSETLMEVARHEEIGYEVVANSNPEVDPWKPGYETEIILPGEVLIPYGAKHGLTVNLAELRLFHIRSTNEKKLQIDVYPLGIGREGRETPEGQYRVTVKKESPYWRVPKSLREQDPTLPAVVPPGPKNPLGDFWLGLSASGYGIHGTNRPLGVGRRVSYGCLRMYPDHIARLYKQIKTGTPVQISYQPIKAAKDGSSLFLEVHPDFLNKYNDPFQAALTVISKTGWSGEIDYMGVKKALSEKRSLPILIGSKEAWSDHL